jgi:release factor glutamine methyltransferase
VKAAVRPRVDGHIAKIDATLRDKKRAMPAACGEREGFFHNRNMSLSTNNPNEYPEHFSVRNALAAAHVILAEAGVDTPRLDAQMLLTHILGCRREQLAMRPERELDRQEWTQYARLVDLRSKYHPLAYIVGHRWFYGIEFLVTPAVLIPRPETEILVEQIVERAPKEAKVLDIATGSGCIAVSAAVKRPDLTIVATDISAEALDVARQNCLIQNVQQRVQLRLGDLLEPIGAEMFDVIVSNPPYIALTDIAHLMPEVRDFEPPIALWEGAGRDGLSIYRRLIPDALGRLNPNGVLAVEVGMGQADAARDLGMDAGAASSEIICDGAGIERVVVFLRK